jgi:hypothetical protein
VTPIEAPTIHRLLRTGFNAAADAAAHSTLPNLLLITISGMIGTAQVVDFSGPLFPAFPASVTFETPVIFTAHPTLEASLPSKASVAFEWSVVLKAPDAFEMFAVLEASLAVILAAMCYMLGNDSNGEIPYAGDILDELRLRAASVEDAALVAETLSIRDEKG